MTYSEIASAQIEGTSGQTTPVAVEGTSGAADVIITEQVCCSDNDVVVSDAIMKIRPLFTNGYETEGQVWRPYKRSATFAGARLWTGTGELVYHSTGGRANGGHVTTVASVENDFFGKPVGQYQALWLAPGETAPKQSSIAVAFNLFGQALTQPMNCIGWGQQLNFYSNNSFFSNAVVQILPDLSIRFVKTGVDIFGALTYTQITLPSIIKVPANGWFQLDTQVGTSIFGNPFGGFVRIQLYKDGAPLEGYNVGRAIGVDLTADLSGRAWGTEVVGRYGSRGLTGIGIDDVIVSGPYGTIKRPIGDTYIGAAIPNAAGDETNSEIGHTSGPLILGTDFPTDVGVAVIHGELERWKNVTGTPMLPDIQTNGTWWFGATSIFTGIWLLGPFLYPIHSPLVDPTVNTQVAEELVPRNTLYDDLRELYKVAVTRGNIISVEGVFPYIRTTARFIAGFDSENYAPEPDGALPEGVFPPNISLISRYADNFGQENTAVHDMRLLIKLGGVETTSDLEQASSNTYQSADVPRFWQVLAGYKVAPYSFVIAKPGTTSEFLPSELASTQIGLRGVTGRLGNPRGQVDYCEIGFEFAHHIAPITLLEHDPFPPKAAFRFASGTNLPTRHVVITDASLDWDGIIASVSVDWGDGIVQAIAPLGTLSHDYAVPGYYTITLTATDNDGLTDTFSAIANAFVINVAPNAVFSIAANTGDPSGQTINFTDLSTDDNAVVAWDWNFGDGSPHSNLQNPTHAYLLAGTYTVTLIATDAGGQAGQPPLSDSTTANITVPVVVPLGDCDEFIGVPGTMIQGDDYAGGNPPLPAYVNTDAFDQYYYGFTFREAYDNSYDSYPAIAHTLDTTRLFRGHPTLKMWFGKPSTITYAGAGWDTIPTDDASPEVYYSTPIGPRSFWHRIRWTADAGVMSQSSLIASSTFQGLETYYSLGNAYVGFYNRAGHIYLDVSYINAAFVSATLSYDLGLETDFVGRGDTKFGEMIIRIDATASTVEPDLHIRVWKGEACTLTGTSPVLNQTIAAYTRPTDSTFKKAQENVLRSIGHFNYSFVISGALKNLWVATWSLRDASVYSNPYNVSLT